MKPFAVLVAFAVILTAVTASAGEPFAFEEDGKYGFKDDDGKVVIPPTYVMAYDFDNGMAAVVVDKGWVYIDTKGTTIISTVTYDNGPDPFEDGLARFEKDGKIGFFDTKGEVVIPATFDYAFPFSCGRAAVCKGCKGEKVGEHTLMKGGLWGYIDTTGAVVVPLEYEFAGEFEDDTAGVTKDGKSLTIDKSGKVVPEEAPAK